jgi:hypothetical protein
LMNQVADQVGQSFKDYDKLVNERMAKTIQEAISKAIKELREQDRSKAGHRAAIFGNTG